MKKRLQDLRLRHYSAEPLGEIRSVSQVGRNLRKPGGLWVSVHNARNNWPQWCKSEDYGLASLANEHEIILADTANVCWLKNAKEIDKFTKQYVAHEHKYNNKEYIMYLDWVKVSSVYQGLIISPYCYSRRLEDHTIWYYGWDCASGCVWDASAISSVRPINHTRVARG